MKTTQKPEPAQNETVWPMVHTDAAGLDIGASEIWACVPAERATPAVRNFSTFTPFLPQLSLQRDWWLAALGL